MRKTVNIGIRLHDTAPGTLPERLGFARKQGFNCVHLALSKLLPGFAMAEAPALLTDTLSKEIRRDLDDAGLDCALLGCYLTLATKDAEALERTRDVYRAHLSFAAGTGIRLVGTETPAAKDLGGDIHSKEALDWFVQCVKPVVRAAEEAGVTLGIEPVACHIVNTPERAEQMLDALKSDRVGIILDAVNLLSRENCHRADAVIDDAIARLGNKVCLLHMKDYTVNPDAFMTEACACGTGLMKYDRLLSFAAKRGLAMTLENTTPENAERARRFLEERLP